MEAELSAVARASIGRALADRGAAEYRGRGIAAFALHFDAASGEHVLSCLYGGPEPGEPPESAAQQAIEVARSNRGDLLGAIARSLAAEYGVPLREVAEVPSGTGPGACRPSVARPGDVPPSGSWA